jgi:WD40 repeat protein
MTQPRLTNGHSWNFEAPVIACIFDSNGIGAFACGDGTLRVFIDERPPHVMQAHRGAILSLTVHPKGGFLTGGDDGRLVHSIPGDEPREIFAHKGRWIENVAASEETGLIACTVGKDAIIFDSQEQQTKYSHATTATGIAFDPKGRRIAVSHYNGASLWWTKSTAQEQKTLSWKGSHLGVMWSPDGKFLITTMQENALHGWRVEDGADMRMSGYPSKIKSLAWERRGKVLFTSGASRVVGWPFTGRNGPMGREPIEIGPDRDGLVQVVAAHPELDMVAAGTSDGAVWFEWIGEEGANFMLLDAPKISAMAFSPEGSHLAIGTDDGYAALVEAA